MQMRLARGDAIYKPTTSAFIRHRDDEGTPTEANYDPTNGDAEPQGAQAMSSAASSCHVPRAGPVLGHKMFRMSGTSGPRLVLDLECVPRDELGDSRVAFRHKILR